MPVFNDYLDCWDVGMLLGLRVADRAAPQDDGPLFDGLQGYLPAGKQLPGVPDAAYAGNDCHQLHVPALQRQSIQKNTVRSMLNGTIRVLDECGSTNTEAADRSRYRHGDAVIAVSQTAGRDSGGHRWVTAPGENLTFTLVVESTFLPVARQFLLSEIAALAVVDTLRALRHRGADQVDERCLCRRPESLRHADRAHARKGGTGPFAAGGSASMSIRPNSRSGGAESLLDADAHGADLRRAGGVRHSSTRCFGARYDRLTEPDRGRRIRSRITGRSSTGLGRPGRFFVPGRGRGGRYESAGWPPTAPLQVEIDGRVRGFLFREIEFVL